MTDTDEGRAALGLSVELSARLGLRLVLAHVIERDARLEGDGDAGLQAERRAAAHLLAQLATEHGVAATAKRREAIGEPAAQLSRIAAEEAADLILVGARTRGRLRGGLECRLARELETETPVPVLIAPPLSRRARLTN